MKPTTFTYHIFLIALVFIGFAGYSFITAYDESFWFPPETGSVPPQNNVAAPINVGTTTQLKSGDLGVDQLVAFTDVRATRYCDLNGANCLNTANPLPSCLPGQSLITNAAGNWDCSLSIVWRPAFTVAFNYVTNNEDTCADGYALGAFRTYENNTDFKVDRMQLGCLLLPTTVSFSSSVWMSPRPIASGNPTENTCGSNQVATGIRTYEGNGDWRVDTMSLKCATLAAGTTLGSTAWAEVVNIAKGDPSTHSCAANQVATGIRTYEGNGDWIVDSAQTRCSELLY